MGPFTPDAVLGVLITVIGGLLAAIIGLLRNRVVALEKDSRSDAEIIALINGRYVRSQEMTMLLDRLNKNDVLVERLRAFKDHDYANDKTTYLLQVAELEKQVALLQAAQTAEEKQAAIVRSALTLLTKDKN